MSGCCRAGSTARTICSPLETLTIPLLAASPYQFNDAVSSTVASVPRPMLDPPADSVATRWVSVTYLASRRIEKSPGLFQVTATNSLGNGWAATPRPETVLEFETSCRQNY